MQRRHLLIGTLLALLLLAAACGGDDGGSSSSDEGDGDTGEEASTTTEVATPANPDGDFFILRWQTGFDLEPNETQGLATTRLWHLEPTCDGDEPCDLDLSGAGEGGTYDPPQFPPPEGGPPDPTVVPYDAGDEVWVLEEDNGPAGNCRGLDGAPIAGDFTTMDQVDRTELAWDETGTILTGTKTETFVLNDAGRANPDCDTTVEEDAVSYDVVAVPQDVVDDGAGAVTLLDSYVQTREVYAVEGTASVQVYDWRVFHDPAEGDGECTEDDCDATLRLPLADEPLELELEWDGGTVTGSSESIGECWVNGSLDSDDPQLLTEEGYTVTVDLEIVPIPIDEDGTQALVAHGDYVATPLPEAAAEFPEDCATVETTGAFYYLIPSDRVPSA